MLDLQGGRQHASRHVHISSKAVQAMMQQLLGLHEGSLNT